MAQRLGERRLLVLECLNLLLDSAAQLAHLLNKLGELCPHTRFKIAHELHYRRFGIA